MQIEYKGKRYPITRDPNTGQLFAGKKFAGYGEGNMNRGFRLVDAVPEVAPAKKKTNKSG